MYALIIVVFVLSPLWGQLLINLVKFVRELM